MYSTLSKRFSRNILARKNGFNKELLKYAFFRVVCTDFLAKLEVFVHLALKKRHVHTGICATLLYFKFKSKVNRKQFHKTCELSTI